MTLLGEIRNKCSENIDKQLFTHSSIHNSPHKVNYLQISQYFFYSDRRVKENLPTCEIKIILQPLSIYK